MSDSTEKKTPMISHGFIKLFLFWGLQIPWFQHWEFLEAEKKQFSRPVISGWVKLGTHQTATEYSCKSGGILVAMVSERFRPTISGSILEMVRRCELRFASVWTYASQMKKKRLTSHLLVPSVDVAKYRFWMVLKVRFTSLEYIDLLDI